MNRTRHILTAILLSAVTLLPSACHNAIWDKLNDHEARISKLEAFCNQLNTNINSLQVLVDAINARDYVKDVTPVTEDGLVIGYTISFGARNPITIFNGKNGEDAPTPIIGIKQDTDEIWYWTLNGDWILDSDGQKVRADGVSPQLKIEDDCWWVSYDNGHNWTQMGPAVGTQITHNATTALMVGAARGAAIIAASEYTENLFEYTPMQIKQAVTGYGSADKKQVQQMVKMLLNLPALIRPDDAADAVAAALTHAASGRMKEQFLMK